MGNDSTVPMDESVQFPAGTTLGRCRLIKMIGAGGMGTVYLAHHEALDKNVAVKVLPSRYSANSEYVRRFQREARSAAKLEHPNIIQILDVANDGDVNFIVMQYYEGMDLGRLIDRKGKVSITDALSITKKVAQALGAAHKAGIVHRDIKPSNIVITKQGKVLVTDFGLAREIQGTMTGSNITQSGGIVLGTPQYISPEQAMGERSDARSDIYSLGATLYGMLAGRPPYNDDNPVAVLMKHVREHERPDPLRKFNPEVGEPLEKMVEKMMAKQPDQRFSSMEEVVNVIDAIRGSRGTGTVGMARVKKPRPWLAIGGGVLFGMICMIVLLVIMVASSAAKDLAAADELERTAGTDRIKLEAAVSKFRDIVARYPNTDQAKEASMHISDILGRLSREEMMTACRQAQARYNAEELPFSTAFKDLRRLKDRKGPPEIQKAIEETIDDISKTEIKRLVERLAKVLKFKDAARLAEFLDPALAPTVNDRDGVRKILEKLLNGPAPSGAQVKSLEMVAGSLAYDRSKLSAGCEAKITIITETGESSPPPFPVRWRVIQDSWCLVLDDKK